MVGAIEKQKFVYVLNRDSEANLTISSPLEAHKSNTLTLSMVGVDVGYENPTFACLEVNYEADMDDVDGNLPPKMVTYYELDLGLNHITRKWTEETDVNANMLLQVPGEKQGPGGVLVCAENYIIFKNIDHDEVKAAIPRRLGTENVLIVSAAVHVQKNFFFFLLQSEFGDIYKVTLQYEEDEVQGITVQYFDSIAPAASMCVMKTGFLFAASEFAHHYLFQFQGIGDDDDTAVTSSEQPEEVAYFNPRDLTNLALIDEVEALNPVLGMKVADLAQENTPQIYALCGRGCRSSLRVLRHGLEVTEMAVSDLPGVPNAVWAIKHGAGASDADSAYCKYIVVSFVNATIVLSIGDTVAEVKDSGILETSPTLSMSVLEDGSMLQICPDRTRHILSDGRIKEWNTPGKKSITCCAVNGKQVVLGLTGAELVYFELNNAGQLMDVHRKTDLDNDISSLVLSPVPAGRQRAHFMAVGSYDNTVRILSLDPTSIMQQLTLQALPAQPTSLELVNMQGSNGQEKLYLYVGLQNGILIRSVVSTSNGSVSDSRKRFLGTRPVRLFQTGVSGHTAITALSSRSWLSYVHQGRHEMTPLSYDALEYCSSFSSEQCPEGMVAVTGSTLRVFTVERLGQLFNQTVVPLRYTPRKLEINPGNNHLIILESDQNSYSEKNKQVVRRELGLADDEDEKLRKQQAKMERKMKKENQMQQGSDEEEEDEDEDEDEDSDDEGPSEQMIGVPQAGKGKWGSCIRVMEPVDGETTCLLELEDQEAAFSMCLVSFANTANQADGVVAETFLAVGTVKDLTYVPRKMSASFIHIYRFTDQGTKLELLHKTEVHAAVLALTAFQGKLLAGVGGTLRMYDLGKKKLLRKCENSSFPSTIVDIKVQGTRLYVADQCESFHFVSFDDKQKQFTIYADTETPRYITASTVVDRDTLAGADKFGNIFVSRLPGQVSEALKKDPSGGQIRGKYGDIIYGSSHKLTDIVQFHVGEVVTSLTKTSLVPGGTEVLLYSTLQGSIGIMMPFSSKENLLFFSHLEMHLRQENPPLLGRDHLAYRSYYFPVKDCLDGDLCQSFTALPAKRQNEIAEELLCKPSDITKKMEEMKNRVL